MAGAGFVDATASHELFDPVAKVAGGDAGAVAAEEQRGFAGQMGEMRAGIGQKALHPCGGTRADGQHPAFAAFATAHGERAAVRIVVAEVEVGHFGAADAGGVEEFEHRTVAQAKGIGDVGQGEETRDFALIKGFWQLADVFARQVEVGSGVGRDGAIAAHRGEKPTHAAEASDLGVDAERPVPTRGTILVQKSLIRLKIGAGEVREIRFCLLPGPGAELPQRPAVRVDGGG